MFPVQTADNSGSLHLTLNDTVIAIAAAMVLFSVPISRSKGEFALDWEAARNVPWGVLLLFGGGLALAGGFSSTGLAEWIGNAVGGFDISTMLLILAVTIAIVYLTEITSNTASTATFLPILGAVAVGLSLDPMLLTKARVDEITRTIDAAQKSNPVAKRLATIPGVGPLTSSVIAATVPEVSNFRTARDLSAWLGLTPKPHSSGGKEHLGRISSAKANAIRPREPKHGKSIHPQASVPWCHGAGLGAAQTWPWRGLALEHAATKAGETGCHCTGQPHGPRSTRSLGRVAFGVSPGRC